ncbi:MAG: hypothetical protein WBH51_01925 [Mycolicibacter algericus]|uniref:hypothetical protein n=1 Tax=Mycolicibacter algericus TaxID=1288388 RepID=UPI003C778A59
MTGIEGAGYSAPGLPDHYVTDDGYAITTVIAEPGWLYAWQTTGLDTGQTWLSVRRSTAVPTDSPLHQRLLELLGSATLLGSEVSSAPDMMFGTADLSIWAL